MQMGVEQDLAGNHQSEIAHKCSTCKLTPSMLAIVNYLKKEPKYRVASLQTVREQSLSLTVTFSGDNTGKRGKP